MRSTWSILALCLAACGGGGGGGGGGDPGPPPPAGTSVRFEVADVEIPAGANSRELLVVLAEQPATATALLQVCVELPPQLTLPANDRLRAAASVVTLDGDFVAGDAGATCFVVLCGDATNANAQPLGDGELFGLTLQPATPRTPGTYTVTLRDVRAAAADGSRLEADPNPVTVKVTIL